jgi:hypothetical protein
MATKPDITDARWGETVGGAAATNLAEANDATKDTGLATNAPLPSGLLNFMWRQAYRWFKYVDELFTDIAGTAWTWTATHIFNGTVTLNGTIGVAGNPAATTGVTNKLTAKSIAKAWARIQLNGTASPTLVNGLNVTSVSAGVGGLSVTIADDLAGTTHGCPVANTSIAASFCTCVNGSAGSVSVHIYDGASAAAEWNPATQQSGQVVFFALFGEQ